MLSILQVGLGPLGRRVADDLVARRLGAVVAAVDTAPELEGSRVSDARVTADLESALAADFDVAIVTTSSDLSRCADTFRALLRRGAAVVSTCEELLWPTLRHPDLTAELDGIAKEHGGRLLGTGINPGYVMDALPVVATMSSSRWNCRSLGLSLS